VNEARNPTRPSLPSLLAYGYSPMAGRTSSTRRATDPAPGRHLTSDPVVTVNEKKGDFYLCGLFDPANATATTSTGVAWYAPRSARTSINWSTPVVVKSLLETDGFIDKPLDRGRFDVGQRLRDVQPLHAQPGLDRVPRSRNQA